VKLAFGFGKQLQEKLKDCTDFRFSMGNFAYLRELLLLHFVCRCLGKWIQII
jgi:hypothetical protein